MPNPDGERMDALTESIVRLLKRVERIEDRLSRLEVKQTGWAPSDPPQAQPADLGSPPPIPSMPHPPPLPVSPRISEARAETPAVSRPPEPEKPDPIFAPHAGRPADAAAPQHLETRMGLTWINRIGVITLVIGVAFFFKYAIDNRWIGETGRVILGVAAGFAAIAAGDVLRRRGQPTFAQGICGLGIGILYLSFYATFGFYHLLPQAAAFGLMAMTTVLAGALALRHNAMAIAALGLLSGYGTPILLSTGQDAPWTFFTYVFLISLGAVTIARPRRWRALDQMAFAATVILYARWFGEWFRPEKQLVATVAALAFYALFAFVEWSWIFYVTEALVGFGLTAMWPEPRPYLVLSLFLGAAGLIVAAGTFRKPWAAMWSFATFWGAYAVWRYPNGKPDETVTIFLLLSIGFGMYLVWTPFQLLRRRAAAQTHHLIMMAANGPAYFAASYALLVSQYKTWLGLLAAAVAGAYVLVGLELWKNQSAESRDNRPAVLAFGIGLGFLTLAVPIQFSGFSVTLSWALEAAALVWIGHRMKEGRLWFAAVAVYLFVFLRLYMFDAWAPAAGPAPLINSRFLTFTVSAIAFWLGARWIRAVRPVAAAIYVTGHLIMLSVCLLEFGDWVGAAVSEENQTSLMAIGVSLLMALYAVILMGAGVARQFVLDRILALGLIGLVVLKLYLYDVWEASRLFRMAAFVGLGLLLLLTSYLYSRFRPKIENWWKDEKAPM